MRSLLLASFALMATLLQTRATIPDLDSFAGPAPNPWNGFCSLNSTNPSSTPYTSGSSSRLAFYVSSSTWTLYPGWLAFYKSLVMIGIPVKVTTDISEAIKHPVVFAYQTFAGTVSPSDVTTWTNYVNNGSTLITTTMTSTAMQSLFGITSSTTNSNSREVILLQNVTSSPGSLYMSQFDYTNTRDSQIPLWGTFVNKSFPTTSYTCSGSTIALGYYALHSKPTVPESYCAISLKTYPNNGQAIAFGLDIGKYIGISQGNNTMGIPRDYAATYEPGYDTFLRIIKAVYINSKGYITIWPVPSNMGVHYVWSYDIDAQDSWSGAVDRHSKPREYGRLRHYQLADQTRHGRLRCKFFCPVLQKHIYS